MGPLEELSKKAIRDRRKEIAEGTMDKLADRDLLSILRERTATQVEVGNPLTSSARQHVRRDSAGAKDVGRRDHRSARDIHVCRIGDYFVSEGGAVARSRGQTVDRYSGTISWALHALACRPQMQSELRTECQAYGESLPFEQLDQLPYLDAVVMEVLRVYPSLPSTVSGIASRLDAAYTPQIREAQKDDIIPLAEPVQDRNGKTVSSIRIRKGQVIYVPIEQLQVATCVWGPDARDFNPGRWLDNGASHVTPDSAESALSSSKLPPGVPDGPGVSPNIMTFIDGPRRCVGYKLALMQIKMILYALIRDFEFAPVPEKKIYKWNL